MTARTDVEPRSKGLLTPGAPVRIARLFPGSPATPFVRHYWLPRWELPAGGSIRQDVLEYPTANLVVEPDGAALFRAHRGLSTRTLEGSGWAFGVLLHPGVARGWVGTSLRGQPSAIPLGRLGLGGEADMTTAVRAAMARGDEDAAVAAFESWLDTLPEPDEDARLVDRIVAEVERDRELLRVEELAERFGLGVRHLQRLVAGHIGFGPKWLIQRYRLQEAAAALRSDDPPQLAALAAELGYADQAHFSREFKAVVGATPGSYASEVRR
ncbi:AraC family transcriptional regulator [Leifsonia sp. ku-ls]|nr:AraC family transcriptional regulator [Leifsonia sp. ku-ls]